MFKGALNMLCFFIVITERSYELRATSLEL